MFDVAIGEPIGRLKRIRLKSASDEPAAREEVDFSTGAVVLDVRFDEKSPLRDGNSEGGVQRRSSAGVVVTYLDPIDGRAKTHTQAADHDDATRRRLIESEGG